jgi:hypothetical protein
MAPPPLPPDFKELLRLLNETGVRYLLVGGHAVGAYGFVRYTGDLDLWVAVDGANARRIVDALHRFGFAVPALAPELFEQPQQIVRMGVPPLRVEIHTSISGVEFDGCFGRRVTANIEGIDVPMISLADLKVNKTAAGRLKDQLDLENLPE